MTSSPASMAPRAPPIHEDQLEKEFMKGRELRRNFILTMAKRKGYLDWIRFLYQFLDREDPRFERWVAFYTAAMKVDLFCKPGVEPDPMYRGMLHRFPRSPDVENQWYQRYAPGWIESFENRVQKEHKANPRMLAGLMSMDTVMEFPDRLVGGVVADNEAKGKGRR